MTGALPVVDGVHTFTVRQSSDVGVPSDISCSSGSCGQAGPSWLASRGSVEGFTGAGGNQRRSPTGGAAYGMPRKTSRSPSTVPWTGPAVVCTTGPPSAAFAVLAAPAPPTISSASRRWQPTA